MTDQELLQSLVNKVDGMIIRLHDLRMELQNQSTRIDVLENFVREKFPEHFAGEVGTVADPDLKPVSIDFVTKPQEFSETDNNGNIIWYRIIDGIKTKIGDGNDE
ncbi:MAG: hypothetical protein KGJ13_06490 [Patescibacteria group bacterium]|nr:hypothetical protein [Patescibacteria group bacterium]